VARTGISRYVRQEAICVALSEIDVPIEGRSKARVRLLLRRCPVRKKHVAIEPTRHFAKERRMVLDRMGRKDA
jgi:hypothetical protein